MKRVFVIVSFLAFIAFLSCKKTTTYTAGKNGNATMTVRPFLSRAVNNILATDTTLNGDTTSRNLIGVVYIKYNDQDTAVTDISHSADDSVVVNGTGLGDIQFYSLATGAYYVYFKGVIYKQPVQGGNSYFITSSKEVPIYIIPQ